MIGRSFTGTDGLLIGIFIGLAIGCLLMWWVASPLRRMEKRLAEQSHPSRLNLHLDRTRFGSLDELGKDPGGHVHPLDPIDLPLDPSNEIEGNRYTHGGGDLEDSV